MQGLFFSLLSDTIDGGLIRQLDDFIIEHPDTKVVFIDTLQKVRNGSFDSAYANDYREMSVLKSFADAHSIAIVLIHHLRKARDSDPFNMISGTTGLSGCVDGSFVLVESKRGERHAKLHCVGRDIENQELELHFDMTQHRWINDDKLSSKNAERLKFVKVIVSFVREKTSFTGTPTELTEMLKPYFEQPIFPNRITRDLVQNKETLSDYGVEFKSHRGSTGRTVALKLRE